MRCLPIPGLGVIFLNIQDMNIYSRVLGVEVSDN